MNENRFWQIIDRSSDSSDFYGTLTDQLFNLNSDELLSFHYILTQKLAQSCVFPLLAANFVISSYVSDDGFKDFRAWLISRGSRKFFSALDNPESITGWLSKSDVDMIDGESLLSASQSVYDRLYDDDFLEKAKFEPEPILQQDWPEDKNEYRKKWPKLVDEFWDIERIREMHSD